MLVYDLKSETQASAINYADDETHCDDRRCGCIRIRRPQLQQPSPWMQLGQPAACHVIVNVDEESFVSDKL